MLMQQLEAYRDAEDMIERARISGKKELQLGGPNLIQLPQSLFHLTDLRSLIITGAPLQQLPRAIGDLAGLRTLTVTHCTLTVLPDSIAELKELTDLDLSSNNLTSLPASMAGMHWLDTLVINSNHFSHLPEWLGDLRALQHLGVGGNRLNRLPEELQRLDRLAKLFIWGNPLPALPVWITSLHRLTFLNASDMELTEVPDEIGKLRLLAHLVLDDNRLSDLPESLTELTELVHLGIANNPLSPELAAADQEGLGAVMRYLRAKAEAQVVLNEAKLILIGEGEVGKSCLLGALRGDQWEENRPTTHGIEIKPVQILDPDTGTILTLNGWDFGGQRVYRPTHQLFFSAPAIYLVVWKPREGPQQGFVKEWIKLVKHREPDAKILVVATHGGPRQRQPDVDRQELWDLFGRDTVRDFLLVDSRPDEKTEVCPGIVELKWAIARLATSLPEIGRAVPARWQKARSALKNASGAYLPLESVLFICRQHQMDEEEAKDFVRISHRLGHLIHYEHDPALRDVVVLKPDWLATAISFVLDDPQTREANGLVKFERLRQLWDDPEREEEHRYPQDLHAVFLRLMERFDLSYRIARLPDDGEGDETSLIAQLVPDVRPERVADWLSLHVVGDTRQVQICRIVEKASGESAAAEGLFYQLIVRLHKYSLGRVDYRDSVHWQRGLLLDDDYNGQALLEHVTNDVRITVSAAYPERFLSVLTSEVKWLVDNFWDGLRCDVMVPCQTPCGHEAPGKGLFDVSKLIDSRRNGRPEYPCPICSEWQNIDGLLRNAPAAQRARTETLFAGFAEVKRELRQVRKLMIAQHDKAMGRFDGLDFQAHRTLSRVDDAFTELMQTLTDEARDGPRLFSFQPLDPGFFDKPAWVSHKFRLTLWCEHSRLPLPALNGAGDERGVYELTFPREWAVKAAPFLRVITGTLSLVLPVASSATRLVLDDATYKGIDKELELGQKSAESLLKSGEAAAAWLGRDETSRLSHGDAAQARGGVLRQLHAMLKDRDPSWGGLVRVRNKRQEFLWVHPQFEKEY